MKTHRRTAAIIGAVSVIVLAATMVGGPLSQRKASAVGRPTEKVYKCVGFHVDSSPGRPDYGTIYVHNDGADTLEYRVRWYFDVIQGGVAKSVLGPLRTVAPNDTARAFTPDDTLAFTNAAKVTVSSGDGILDASVHRDVGPEATDRQVLCAPSQGAPDPLSSRVIGSEP